MNQSVLKVKPAKFVTVRSDGTQMQLCCVGRQTRGTSVQISTRYEHEKIRMAFTFKYANNYYSVMVDRNTLKLKETASSDLSLLPEQCWFERWEAGSGEHYILRSVVEPGRYLSLPENSFILGLSEEDDQCVLVTDEEVPLGFQVKS